ncbi:hypothetical protein BH09SUM1_BH09SUM1_20010 [soil metagenome]
MRQFQACTWQEDDGFVAQCLDIDIVSEGDTEAEALANLREALELFFEEASPAEIEQRMRAGVHVARVEAAVG